MQATYGWFICYILACLRCLWATAELQNSWLRGPSFQMGNFCFLPGTRRWLKNAGFFIHSARRQTRIYRWPSGTGRVYRIRTPYVPTIQDCLCFSQIARLGSEHFLWKTLLKQIWHELLKIPMNKIWPAQIVRVYISYSWGRHLFL